MRTWRTGLDPARGADYHAFARDVSAPMFARHDGFRGVVLALAAPDERVVVTFWRDRAAVAALERSPDYARTVAALGATGMLRAPQQVEVLDVHGGSLLAADDG